MDVSEIAKLKLPIAQNPSVIDSDMILAAIGFDEEIDGDVGDDVREVEETKEFLLKTTQTLRLEFMRILKLENLHYLTALTRLFLDNNFIERISGLDQLYHLTWLDLSFNNIIKIEGLEALKKLEVLALYSNKIVKIENLAHLSNLKVLRLGRNKIANKDDVIYLRRYVYENCSLIDPRGRPIVTTAGNDHYFRMWCL